jgi:hypothetical protein
VSVLYAADDGHGLSADSDDLRTQYTTSVKGKKEDGEGFGFALAVGTSTAAGTRISPWVRPEKSLATTFIVPVQ